MIKPLNDYVVLQSIEEEKVTASGIYLGSTASKQPKGKVVAVKYYAANNAMPSGCGIFLSPVKVGDIVYYKNSIEIKEGEETYLLVKESDLLCVVKDGER